MLAGLLRELNERQDEIRQRLQGITRFRERAQALWVRYTPSPRPARMVGVDSGWNYRAFQGYFLYAVDAAALADDGSFVGSPRYEVNVGTLTLREGKRVGPRPKLLLQSKGMAFEHELAVECYDMADYVLVDGSLLARFYDLSSFRTTRMADYFTDLMGKERLLFVSKASYSTKLLRGELGDTAYFNALVPWAGYTKPEVEGKVSFFYARLADFVPALRVEVPVDLKEQEARELMDLLSAQQVHGYPNVLRLVDREVRVRKEDLNVVAALLGLEAEAGARDVLS